ncbi:L,D-transpeptidase family protein [Palleronia rufa]|uniref:L,D-transpeptidase family protein n=1 Tax=Palleronia rufa TaxID=1530186 RepID=UPI0005601535|nr:L,D-transpeptidase family protein [Palleronia rufa]
MSVLRIFLLGLVLFGVAGCGGDKFRTYDGPDVTQVLLYKGERKLLLLNGQTVLEQYDVGLGFAPQGHKQFEGDGRTPEGNYLIDKRNPNSQYHLSVGISYPNPVDVARAAAMGKDPGGDIFIHGRGPTYKKDAARDWTWGCIAVKDREIEEIYAMVTDGTPISIFP